LSVDDNAMINTVLKVPRSKKETSHPSKLLPGSCIANQREDCARR